MHKPIVDIEQLTAAVIDHYGKITHMEPVPDGMESFAFRVVISGKKYVLRVNHQAEGFEKDDFANRHFAAPGLPVPEIEAIGLLENGVAWCLSAQAPGVTLQDLPEAYLTAVTAPVAAVMQAMAAAPLQGITGFGPFNSRGETRHTSWKTYLESICREEHYDWHAAGKRVPLKRIRPLQEQLLQQLQDIPETRQLVHGDFGSNNVLTDGHKITGVIDWSEAMIGDSLYDMANIFFWRTWLDCMEYQARYFETQPVDKARLDCYQLHIGLTEVYQTAIAGDMDDMDWALVRCEHLAGISR
ncbi:aminoglycoside phosphotransferase family protein [Chitinophaga varians]|uniref:Aminoglycoside phosphotransferase family protein n=1 Tax=Chitinophaga varians TaxID=2202339 RepID=A0A847RK52_9BACT|nr:aminoglycoside phosphotransferase family protein [Chitinophaga varians]NLR67399.1 aminoglycoside phosphotransferase family protein [Chitinophaga varians]